MGLLDRLLGRTKKAAGDPTGGTSMQSDAPDHEEPMHEGPETASEPPASADSDSTPPA